MQLLLALNDSFSNARGNILMMTPLPSVDEAFAILKRDVEQRGVKAASDIPTNLASFHAQYKHFQKQQGQQQPNTNAPVQRKDVPAPRKDDSGPRKSKIVLYKLQENQSQCGEVFLHHWCSTRLQE